MVANKDQLTAAFHDGDQSARFRRLRRFIHQYNRKFTRGEKAMSGANGGGADDFGLVKNAGRHLILHSSDVFLMPADVSMHEAFLPTLQRRKRFA